MEADKLALRASPAGMRYIAQMHLYNQDNWARLHQFINDSYHADLLIQADAPQRLADLQAQYAAIGKLKIKQVLATQEHHVIVVAQAQNAAGFFYTEMKVEAEYPHKITLYMFTPLQLAQE